jgi:hypothetical protein
VDPRAGLDDLEEWKFLTLTGLELVASRYTDYANPPDGFDDNVAGDDDRGEYVSISRQENNESYFCDTERK